MLTVQVHPPRPPRRQRPPFPTQQQIGQTRVGIQTMVTAQLTQQVKNNQLVDTSLTPYIRSRRIKIVGRHFKPGARLYPFFDGVDVSAFCRPYQDPEITPSISDPSWTTFKIAWGGDFSPQDNKDEGVSEDTTDTDQTATLLVGDLNQPIMTDSIGSCTLFFEIPCNAANKFRVGARPFRLTTSITNDVNADAFGDATYNASGLVDQYQETITSIYTTADSDKEHHGHTGRHTEPRFNNYYNTRYQHDSKWRC